MIRIETAESGWVFDPVQIGEVPAADPTPLLHDPLLLDRLAELDRGLPEPRETSDYSEPPQLISRLTLMEPRHGRGSFDDARPPAETGVTLFAAGVFVLLMLTGATVAALLFEHEMVQIVAMLVH
jgi:hypothetical protein